MNFCDQCENIMSKKTTMDNRIIFECNCSAIKLGTAADTLMYHRSNGSKGMQHTVMIENAPFDNAGNKVFKTCKNCGLNFTTKVILAQLGLTYYTCDCGFKVSYQEYENM